MPSEKDLTVEVLTGVRAVPAAEWDALLSPEDTPFVRHAWLSSLEDAGCVRPEVGWLPRTLVVREGGRLVAAAPVYLKGNSEGEFVFDHAWHRFAERLGVAYLPKLIVAVPFTPATGRRLLVAPGEDRDTWRLVLSRALRELVRELDVSSAHVLFAQEGDADALVEDGWAPRVGVQFHWENHGYATYDDFLATFNAKRRHQLKRERREVLASGLDVRTYRGSEITDEVMSAMERFYLASVERFHPWTRQYLNRAFFDLALSRMPESIEIVLARDAGRPIAGAFNVSGGGRLYGRYWGAVEERPFLHFHVCYYHSIEDCIARGLSAFEPGAGGEHKLPRGFEPRLTRSAHVLVDPRLDRAVRQFVGQEKAAIESELAGRDALLRSLGCLRSTRIPCRLAGRGHSSCPGGGFSMSNATRAADQAQVWTLGGMQVTWTNHQPASSLVQWKRGSATAAAAGAPPAMGPALSMVCYELPIWAAFHAGVLTRTQLWNLVHAFDAVGHGSAAAIMAAITSRWSMRRTLGNVAAAAFSRGDIVFFNGVGHVCMATGNPQVPNEVYSVWGMNPIGMQANTPVERTTVGAILAQIAIGAPGLAQVVTYSSPAW